MGDIFSAELNGKRKKPFFMRSLMRAVTDTDHEPFERWARWRDGENAVVWEAHVGGIPVCLIAFESHTRPRTGFVPADGPPSWTSGTLFPQAARKVARAVNAASGNRPVVILANLSGFDGSPESMRTWELEYGAEIGRAVANFRGPIVLVVVSRYHGGAFVAFSKRLHNDMETAAVAGLRIGDRRRTSRRSRLRPRGRRQDRERSEGGGHPRQARGGSSRRPCRTASRTRRHRPGGPRRDAQAGGR